jgi:hypothetical protein
MANSYRGFQKNVTVRLYPEEIQALEVIAKLAGWEGKSTALREFMKVWVECAIVAIEEQSTTKSSYQMLKGMIRINKQLDAIKNNARKSKGDLLHEHDLEILKGCLAK